MKELFREAVRLLEAGESFAMATIISQHGSAPRGIGTRMLVQKDLVIGTVGGGIVEAKVINYARSEVLATKRAAIQFYDMSSKEASDAYLICGGNCEILIFYVDSEDSLSHATFLNALQSATSGDPSWFVYLIDTSFEGGAFQYKLSKNLVHDAEKDQRNGDIRVIIEPIIAGGVIYLFGSGHVSLEVAKLAVNLDFRVVVLEDHEDLAHEKRFPGCEFVVIRDYNHIPELDINNDSYILIITRGHAFDFNVLEWALLHEPYYIGLIGSKNKRDLIYEKLTQKGADPDRLKEVCCPVGLNIGAETPSEIGISIMAELIKKRSEKTKTNASAKWLTKI